MAITLTFYPAFEDQKAIEDHYFRSLWYLSPFQSKIKEIIIPRRSDNLSPVDVPDYLDENIKRFSGYLPITLRTVACETELDECVASSEGVLLWSEEQRLTKSFGGKQVIKIDHHKQQFAGSFYLRIHEAFPHFQDKSVGHHKEIFERIRNRCSDRIGYIFGTGPGLSLALERGHDFSDGVCIACNSMVRNRALMDRIQPPLIAVGDPIFHAGPSSYAAAFRKELVWALDRYSADLVVPMRDYHVYRSHLPNRFSDRIAALPFKPGDLPNLNLAREFHVTATGNILTLFLLPLAATFFDEIRILGCDGRPMEANSYFWNHDKASQFNGQMQDIRKAHPAFFAIDYDDYYLTHCRVLETWLSELEKAGKTVLNCTPSYIPALTKRNVADLDASDRKCVKSDSLDPVVSIVMPALNADRFIEEAIRSVLYQEYADWELLVVDDGSTDKTCDIVNALGSEEPRIRLIPNDRKGVSAARNTGVRAARGRYISFLDADDLIDPGSLKGRVKTLLENDAVDMVHSHYRFIDEASRDLNVVSGIARDIDFRDAFQNPTHCNTIMGKRAVISRMIFPEGMQNGEDWLALARLLRSGVRSRYVAAGSAAYRVHPFSTVLRDMETHERALESVIDWVYSRQDGEEVAPEHKDGISTPTKQEVLLQRYSTLSIWKLLDGTVLDGDYLSTSKEALSWLNRQSESSLRHRIVNVCVRYFALSKDELSQVPRERLDQIASCIGAINLHQIAPRIHDALKDILDLNAERFVVDNNRKAGVFVDETAIVAYMCNERIGQSHVMIDVGAHFGTSASHFDKLGWTIYCFEPDAANRKKLMALHGGKSNIVIDRRGIGDDPAINVPFFKSDESTGVSGLHAFLKTHRESDKIEVTTISNVMCEHGIRHIDFLKIDVEGFDFNVLKGVPWKCIKPDIIECEFEDSKTIPLGHTWRDIADFLKNKGYAVYISEWHPIIRYGIPHDWRRVISYPDVVLPPDAWGNILAFREDPGYATVLAAFQKLVKQRFRKKKRLEGDTSSGSSETSVAPMDASAVPTFSPTSWSDTHRPNYVEFGEWLMPRAPRLFTFLQRWRRRIAAAPGRLRYRYGLFALWVRDKSPLFFRLGQMGAWLLRAAWRRKRAALLFAGVLAVLIAMPFAHASAWNGRLELWSAAGLLFAAASSGVLLREAFRRVVAAADTRTAVLEKRLVTEVVALRNELAALEKTLDGRLAASIKDARAAEKALKVEIERSFAKAKGLVSEIAAIRKFGDQAKAIPYLRERVAAGERQIGALRYPDAPGTLVFFGHHKCASRFFRNEVFGIAAEATGARVRKYEIKSPPFHYSMCDELDLCNMTFGGLGENGRDIVLFSNATARSLDTIQRATDDWKGIRILRDPRQVFVSNYFHHKGGHHTELNGWIWDQLARDKPILRELQKEEGLLYELDNISKQIIETQILCPFDEPRVMTIKIEEFSQDPKAHLKLISEFLGLSDIAGIDFSRTHANPESGSWQNHFTSRLREVFKRRYGQALIDLGYAEDFDW